MTVNRWWWPGSCQWLYHQNKIIVSIYMFVIVVHLLVFWSLKIWLCARCTHKWGNEMFFPFFLGESSPPSSQQALPSQFAVASRRFPKGWHAPALCTPHPLTALWPHLIPASYSKWSQSSAGRGLQVFKMEKQFGYNTYILLFLFLS